MAQSIDQEVAEPVEDLTIQSVFDTLGSERTRHVIRILADAPPEESVPFSDLAEAVTAREIGGEPIDEVTVRARSFSLYQTHLPRLRDIGAISTNSEEGLQVMPHGDVQTLAAILDDIEDRVGQINGAPRSPGSSLVTAFLDFLRRR